MRMSEAISSRMDSFGFGLMNASDIIGLLFYFLMHQDFSLRVIIVHTRSSVTSMLLNWNQLTQEGINIP